MTQKLIDLRHIVSSRDDFDKDEAGLRAFDMWEQPESPEEWFGLEGMEHEQWVHDVHNKFVGERCFLIGSGPSLIDQLPLLDKLGDEYTFTCNRLRFWKEIPFKPFVHTVTEPGPLINYGEGIQAPYDFPEAQNKVICIWWKATVPGWLWLPKAPDDVQMRWQGPQGFDETLAPLTTGWASPLTISQLAAWMGFSEFYFLGCDTTQEGQAWDRENGTTKNKRSIRSTLECFDRFRMTAERNGREVYDCSTGGTVNREGILKYAPLEEVLGG